MDNVISSADVIKRAVRLGAEVRNIRLSGDLSDDALRAIRRLLLEHKVIFFCNQQHLDDAEQQRFAVRLGRMSPSPQVAVTDRTSSFLEPSSGRSSRANQERADVVDGFRNISVLRAVTTTPYRGDTVWSNTVAAYLDLPLSLRMLADELWAVHTNSNPYAVNEQSAEANEMQFDEGGTGAISETNLPVVWTHPETGERTLMLGNLVQRFIGLQKHTGQKLLDLFQSYITAPHNTVRWRWREGDVAIWDKRLTQSANDHPMVGDRDLLPRPPRRQAQKPQADKARAA